MNIQDINVEEIKIFKEDAKNLTDSRIQKKCTYKLWDVVVSSVLAVMANADTFEEIYTFAKVKYDFLKSILQMTGGVATVKTYENIIGMINSDELHELCKSFVIKATTQNIKQDIINIDGKVDKNSARNANEEHDKIKPLNVLNAFSSELGIYLYGLQIDDKTNEIPMFKELIKHINVKGNIITVDALNTQVENAKLIIKLKGDYVFAVKKNQGNLYNDLIEYFNDTELLKGCNSYLTTAKEGGKVVKRNYYQTDEITWLNTKKEWAGLKSIGCVIKETEDMQGNKTKEIRYYISSLSTDIRLFAKSIRSHWKVENNLHWQLDFTFKCDDNRTENKSALLNLQIIKKLVLNMLKLVKEHFNKSLIKIRYIISLNTEDSIVEIFKMLFVKYQKAGFSIFDSL